VGEAIEEGNTGYLVPFSDISGLVRSVSRLIEHPELRQEMGMNGDHRVQRSFSAEQTAKQVRLVIDSVLQGARNDETRKYSSDDK
jgi:glycosyltransferase involved in cell wall biosynthesis